MVRHHFQKRALKSWWSKRSIIAEAFHENSYWRNKMAIKLFQNSSRIQLPYAFLKNLTVAKERAFWAIDIFRLTAFFSGMFQIFRSEFCHRSEQTAPIFFKNSGRNTTHKNSQLHLIFQTFSFLGDELYDMTEEELESSFIQNFPRNQLLKKDFILLFHHSNEFAHKCHDILMKLLSKSIQYGVLFQDFFRSEFRYI